MMNYSYHLLPFLVVIIEEKHMGKAALRLGITQSALSRALAKLREQYKDPLVIRTAVGVEPTIFALQIYPILSKTINDLDSTFSSNIQFNPHIRSHRFSIASASFVNYSLVSKIVEKLHCKYPLINIDIHQLKGGDMLSQLRSKEVDFLIDMDTSQSAALCKKVLYQDKLVLSCRKNHPRIKSSNVDMKQFLREKHVTVSNWKSNGNIFTDEHIKGIEARKIAVSTVGTIESLCLVAKTDFVCLADKTNVDLFSHFFSIKSVELLFDKTEYDVCLYWHPTRNSDYAHQWFRNEIVKLL